MTVAWGICATVRAPLDHMRAFAAHHLSLGAAQVWLHLDDPDDPSLDAISRMRGVTAIPCDARWWGKIRPERHQNRQSRNVQRLYRQAPLPWIAHIDVDEFIDPDRPVAEILAETDDEMIRMRPYEALHDPALPDDIFKARHFRAGAPRSALAFGRHAHLFPHGMLSHQIGKAFFRTGTGLQPRIHGAFRDGTRVDCKVFTPGLHLLHFHAEDPARWTDRLHFRLSRGAYAANEALREHLLALSERGLATFHADIHTPSPERLEEMIAQGLVREAHLNLRGKVDDYDI